MTTMTARATATGLLTAALTTLLALGAAPAFAAGPPPAPTPEQAASAPATLDTLTRFFARDAARTPGTDGTRAGSAAPGMDGALARSAGAPRVDGASVPVSVLSPDFVAGKPGAPVARVEFRATRAVAADGRTASLWTVEQPDGWQVVNIATGDDEIRYAEQGARLLPGGLVFREPQIDAWYVQKGAKVLPLDEDATRAVGRGGTTLAAYRDRVARAYADKLPGSGYARKGAAGGYGAAPSAPAGAVAASAPAGAAAAPDLSAGAAAAGAGAVVAGGLAAAVALRRRTSRT
ncbi:hypothetical protein [Streptomyces sp. NPDC093089]|uniref:hypothetical protein n=1 Tax=Streptomyces sp. NPDC093089 TaxID=3366024 RepID=UPI003801B759